MANPETQAQPQAQTTGVSEKTVFEQLMSGPGISAEKLTDAFKAKDEKASKIKSAVSTLVATLVDRRDLVSDNVIKTIEALIAEMDRKLSEQISIILHHEDFKTLEGTWRGLHHLVFNSETDETLKIRIFNIQKKEVGKLIKDYPGAKFDQSPLFKKVYENEFGMPGGQPYGVLIGDYAFDHSAPDVQILSGMAQIASSAHAPFITSPAPSLLAMESWQELSNPRDLTKIFETPEYAAWKSLRNSEDSRYIGMAMPRFLSRIPYGAKTNPVDDFNFEEDTEGADHTKYVWSNAAYAMGTNITRSFKKFGWTTCIRGLESGGIIEGLPVHTFPTDDGGVDMKCPTEIAITDRREAELAKNGFMPLSHYKNTDYAVFMGAQSLQQPQKYNTEEATANANLSARLPYLFATCRFAHYLKCMVRDKIGSFKEREDMEMWLNNWIKDYCTAAPNSEEEKARRPLAEARVEVLEVKGNPGYYTSKFWLRPHFQLEGLSVSLRLVSKLPSGKS